jgi:ankyrin repeat protein
MYYKAISCIVVFLMLTGCAAQEKHVSMRESKKIITKDDYDDLEIKTPEEEPVEIDYTKGVIIKNFVVVPKVSPQEAIQNSFLSAATYGSLDSLKESRENGGRINFRNDDGETALIRVLKGPYNEQTFLKLKYLISIGSRINIKGKSATSISSSPLDIAVWNTSSIFKSDTASTKPYFAEQILKYLLDQGAYVYGSDDQGRTPLHTAARSDNFLAAKLLLESGADVMHKDIDGKTPLDSAESREMKNLLKHGAVGIKDTN